MLEIKIEHLSNSAFSDTDEQGNISTLYGTEIARQLRQLAAYFDEKIIYGSGAELSGSVNDINGNKTLTWTLEI